MKTREKVKAKFVKSGAVCIARVAVEKPICVELFDQVPQLGRFTLRDEVDGKISYTHHLDYLKKLTAGQPFDAIAAEKYARATIRGFLAPAPESPR